jgi:hypothetical protein
VWVGLLGGAMYVNVFANLAEDKEGALPVSEDRDLGINLVASATNLGIMLASLLELFLDNVAMPKPKA